MKVQQPETATGSHVMRCMIRLAATACLLAVTGFAGPSFAQDWTLESSLSERGFYDDNLLLNPDTKISSFGLISTPRLELERTSPTSTVTLTGSFPYSTYFDHSDLNAADQLINLNADKALSERSSVAFVGAFAHDTTLRSEQDITDRFLAKEVRFTRWDASPSWTYLLSPVDRATFGVSYSDVDYSSNDKTDYRYYGPQISYQHQLSDLAAVTGSLNFNRFEPDDVSHTRTNVYGGLLGYSYKPTERLSVSGALGMSYNVTESDTQPDDNSVGFRLKFDFDYEAFDDTSVNLSLSHDSEPSGDGKQLTRNRANLGFKYRLTELTTFGLNTQYTDNDDYFGVQTGPNQQQGLSRYFSVAPSVTYKFTEELSLVAWYQYRHKMFQSSGGTATSNAAFLTVRYDFPNLSWGGF